MDKSQVKSVAQTVEASTAETPLAAGLQNRALVALSAALLGGFLLFGAGFAHSDALHNAAHDGRHAFAMPCH